MKTITTLTTAAALLASTASAFIGNASPEQDITFQLNIPDTTASSGSGDVFFQISASTAYTWVALGQGSQMANSNIFVMYTSANGQNVTVSPRLGKGHVMPLYNSAADVTVLEGSGVSNGRMTANVRCGNCKSWSGGTMDFTASSSTWIYARKSGNSLNSDDTSANINQHDAASPFSWSLSGAKGGNDVNPFVANNVATAASTSGPGQGSTSAPGQSATVSCTPNALAQSSGGSIAQSSAVAATLAQPSGSGCPTTWPSEYSTSWPTAQPTWASSCYPSGYSASNGRQGGSWPTNAPWQNGGNGGNGKGYDKRQSANYCDTGYGSSGGSSGSGSGVSSSSGSGHDGSNSATFLGNSVIFGSLSASASHTLLTAHGTLASLTFLLILPTSALLIRLASFPSLVYLHATLQLLGLLTFIVAFGLGIYMATQLSYLTSAHPILGIVLLILLLTQPLSGILHHRLFAKYAHRTLWSFTHLSFGRVAILLGIVNGGLGLSLANASTSAKIAYAVIAAIVGLAYITGIIIGEVRRKRNRSGDRSTAAAAQPARAEPPAYYDKSPNETQMRDLGGGGSGRSSGSTPPASSLPSTGLLAPSAATQGRTPPPGYYAPRGEAGGDAQRPYTGT